jgi:hypothetical protein
MRKYKDQLEDLTEENFRKLEKYIELFRFLDETNRPSGQEEVQQESNPLRASRKR